MIHLRGFQRHMETAIYAAWGEPGIRVIMVVLPTGAGKTVLFSKIHADYKGGSAVVAHRSELVSQTSLALARNGVRHRIIGQKSLQRLCNTLHIQELGHSYYDPGARVAACGIDTLIRHKKEHDSWARQCGLLTQDEGHHVLQDNKWGEAFEMFPNAYGLLPTATPIRADGKGLGRHAHGLVDKMVEGPTMRDLVNEGYLTDYRLIVPPSDIDYTKVPTGASGELVMAKLREAVHASTRIVGDVVSHYLRYAQGKLGVTFAVDVEAATDLARAYRAAGVPAEVVSAKTPDSARFAILRKFKNREILQLVNVDLFGEGFDLPAIEVISMVRRTESFSLYAQQFGRALRLMVDPALLDAWDTYTAEQRRAFIAASSKPKAIIIDHVGNVVRHNGPPDKAREWSLDARERRARSSSGLVPIKVCTRCLAAYEAFLVKCPDCGYYPVPADRSTPAMVAGDLVELDPLALAQIRGEIERIDAPPNGYFLEGPAQVSMERHHRARQVAQMELRNTMALWAGWQTHMGRTDQEAYRRFYFAYSVDAATACTLNAKEAGELNARLTEHLNQAGVIPACSI